MLMPNSNRFLCFLEHGLQTRIHISAWSSFMYLLGPLFETQLNSNINIIRVLKCQSQKKLIDYMFLKNMFLINFSSLLSVSAFGFNDWLVIFFLKFGSFPLFFSSSRTRRSLTKWTRSSIDRPDSNHIE